MKEFNLSDKIIGTSGWMMKTKDVKEFIKLLKCIFIENSNFWELPEEMITSLFKKINKLAGKELI